MGTQAPAVVALLVACGPTQWLDETLESLASQDYPNLSVLVVAADPNLVERVVARLPGAHFAHAEGDFAQAANIGMEMVGNAAHVLVCHGDVALAPNAVRLLVEEAYRSNAGITCPKLVAWEAPERLVSVGLAADRLGNVHPLADPGELDQGQHDAVREVFVAPGGAVLVRSDLWRALGGYLVSRSGRPFDDDLELSWRAQLAGARVVVAPQAVVRHREACHGQFRDDRHGDVVPGPVRGAGRLRVLWTCYSRSTLAFMVPLAVLSALLGGAWRLVARRAEPGLPLVALARSLRAPGDLLEARRRTQRLRRVSDFSLGRSQRGAARLRPVLNLGALKSGALRGSLRDRPPVGAAHNEDTSAERATGGARRRGALMSGGLQPTADEATWEGPGRLRWGWPAGVGVVVLALLVAGSRDLLSGAIPHIGAIPTGAAGLSSWWGPWLSGPGTTGLGGASYGPPALFFMGLLGVVCFGSTVLAAHVLVLAPLVLGPMGAYRAARQFGSRRGQLAAGVVYTALPLPYNSMAAGHFSGLVAYAAAPWMLAGLSSVALSVAGPAGTHEDACSQHRGQSYAGGGPLVASTQGAASAASWQRLVSQLGGQWRPLARLALLVGVAAAFAPPMLVVVPLMAVALAAGSLLAVGPSAARYSVAQVLTATSVTGAAYVLLLPWAPEMTFRSPGGQRLGLGHLLGLETGPYGGGLTWALLAVAGVALFIGRGSRLVLAVRMWAVAFASLAAAWAWSPAGEVELLLAPAGAALASCVALGAASVEADLSGYRFGWRQFAPAFGMAAALATVLPLFAWVSSGRFDLPASGAEAAYAFPAPKAGEAYRVLWVGPPGSLPLAGGSLSGRLAFAASLDGLPADDLWPAPPSRLEAAVGEDLAWAEAGETAELGHLLALAGVRYVVVPVEPEDSGFLAALARQVDLSQVGIDPAYAVYANSAWLPVFFAVRDGPGGAQFSAVTRSATQWVAAWGTVRDLPEALPVDRARAGDLLYGAVPPGTWRSAGAAPTTGPLGTVLWRLRAAGGRVALPEPTGVLGKHLAALASLLLWVGAAALAYGRKRRPLLVPAPRAEPADERALVGVGDRV